MLYGYLIESVSVGNENYYRTFRQHVHAVFEGLRCESYRSASGRGCVKTQPRPETDLEIQPIHFFNFGLNLTAIPTLECN